MASFLVSSLLSSEDLMRSVDRRVWRAEVEVASSPAEMGGGGIVEVDCIWTDGGRAVGV